MRHGRGGGGLRRPDRRYRQDQRGRTRHPPHARPVLGRGRRWSRCSWTGRRRDRRSDPGGCRADHQHQRHQRLEPVRPRRQRPGQAGHRSEGRARAEHPGRGLRRVRGGAQPRPRSSGRPAGHRLRPLRFYPLPRRVRGSRRGRQRHPVGQSARADQHAGGHPREHGASTSDSARHLAPTQAVPTSVRVGPDGALYVSELSGFAGSANVLRVVPGHAPTVYASGFDSISDIAFDKHGRLLVLEYQQGGLFAPPAPGALIRVDRRAGTRTTVASTGLSSPTGLAVHDNTVYISNRGASAAGGSAGGQVLALRQRG